MSKPPSKKPDLGEAFASSKERTALSTPAEAPAVKTLKPSAPDAGVPAAEKDSGPDSTEMVTEIFQEIFAGFYAPDDPNPDAHFEKMNPVIDVEQAARSKSFVITLNPIAHDKVQADGSLNPEDLDPDLHDALKEFFAELDELPHPGIKMQEDYPRFKITCNKPLDLLLLLGALAEENDFVSYDSVYVTAALRPDDESFANEEEWRAYNKEAQANHFTNSTSFFCDDKGEFLDVLPLRPYGSRREAAFTGKQIRDDFIIPCSFIQLESLLRKEMGEKDVPGFNPLLGYH